MIGGAITSGPAAWGQGRGNVLQSWQISRNLLLAVGSPPPRPALTYILRPAQSLANYSNSNFAVTIDGSQQDLITGGRTGEIESCLRVQAGESQSSSVSLT